MTSGTTLHPTRVDWWLAVLMFLPVVGSGAALVAGLVDGTALVLLIGGASLVGYGLLLWGLVWPMHYTIGADGVRIRAGRMKLHVPFDRLAKAELSRNPLSSPALSLKRINLSYRKPNGRETFVLISPRDRDAFLADLVAASTRHRLVDGQVVE